MKESFDKNVDFVTRHYRDGLFDTEKALGSLHARIGAGAGKPVRPSRKLWSTVAAAAASVAVAFAAGYGIYSVASDSSALDAPAAPVAPAAPSAPAEAPGEAPSAHVFVFENTPVEVVLKEIGDYYGCTLSAAPTRRRLTATFPDDDLDTIVSVIESVLDIKISVTE